VIESSASPPGREHLLAAALHVVAARGAKGATVRSIADAASVTPGLVVHHFGTKDQLLTEVDALVATRLTDAMTVAPDADDARALMESIAARLSTLIGTNADLRGYLRRSILEASPAGITIFTQFVELTSAALRRLAGPAAVPADPELSWLAVQLVTINLAGVLLEPVLQHLYDADPFDPDLVARRTAANLEFIARALGVRARQGPAPVDAIAEP
jgi:AcrR family transcriptional regulator